MTKSSFREIFLIKFIFVFIMGLATDANAVEIQGRVQLEDTQAVGEAQVRLFDGFEISTTSTDKAGVFRIQNERVTQGEFFVLWVTRTGYRPEAKVWQCGGEDAVMTYPVRLQRLLEGHHGVVAGILYTPARGGRRQPHYGIHRLLPGRVVSIWQGARVAQSAVTDPQGLYFLTVEPGDYTLQVEGISQKFAVKVSDQVTTLQNIALGKALFD